MITIQIVSSKNSARYLFCSKKGYKNGNMIRNKQNIVWNLVLTVFCQKLFATRIYLNKNIAKAQPRLQRQVETNQPRNYTSIWMITKTMDSLDFVRKIIKNGIMFYWKRISKFSKWRRKMEEQKNKYFLLII